MKAQVVHLVTGPPLKHLWAVGHLRRPLRVLQHSCCLVPAPRRCRRRHRAAAGQQEARCHRGRRHQQALPTCGSGGGTHVALLTACSNAGVLPCECSTA